MCKFCWGLVLVLVLIIAGAVYKFGFLGSVIPASDGRTAVQLTAGERDLGMIDVRTVRETRLTGGAMDAKRNMIVPRGWLDFRIADAVPDKTIPLDLKEFRPQ